ncbi:MAG: hypothetical protein U9R20_04825 [Thermodesulfobacteriota bacterium]|nr:hypothetical protein [Thermodesulfobacteriota bacterium]
MGYREISLKLPTDYVEEQIRKRLEKELKIREFSYQIENKSLDARKKNNIHWLVRVGILSKDIKEGEPAALSSLNIPSGKEKRGRLLSEAAPPDFFQHSYFRRRESIRS